jgi:hypothetical protein
MFLLDIILAVLYDAAHIRAVHLIIVCLIKKANEHEIVRGRLSLLSSQLLPPFLVGSLN